MVHKVLIGLTSYNDKFVDGHITGVHAVEAIHPYQVFVSNNCQVEFASETGEFGWDEMSVDKEQMAKEDYDFFHQDPGFNNAVKAVKKASDLNASDYDIVYFSGGHGCCYDFPKAKGLQDLAAEVHHNGGIVAAVCHGPLIFDNMSTKGWTSGSFIKNKSITGFTDIGEKLFNVAESMHQQGLKSVSQVASDNGAKFLDPVGVWDDYTIGDGRVLTGVNPQSASSLAKRCLRDLGHPQH